MGFFFRTQGCLPESFIHVVEYESCFRAQSSFRELIPASFENCGHFKQIAVRSASCVKAVHCQRFIPSNEISSTRQITAGFETDALWSAEKTERLLVL